MGITLKIGEFEAEALYDSRDTQVACESVEHYDAPVNSCDDNSNTIMITGTKWNNFVREVGLDDLFLGEYGLSERVDTAGALTAKHLERFEQAQEAHVPDLNEDGEDYVKRRLDWLVYWTTWALKYCEYPTFVIT